MWKIKTLALCDKESKMVQSLWKIVWQFLTMLSIELPSDPAIVFLSVYPREMKCMSIWNLYAAVYNSFIYNGLKMETIQMLFPSKENG